MILGGVGDQCGSAGVGAGVHYRTNLTFRQVALLFGISKLAANRVVDHLAPLLTLSPVTRKHGPDTVLIVDGTLVPTHDPDHVRLQQELSVHCAAVMDAYSRLAIGWSIAHHMRTELFTDALGMAILRRNPEDNTRFDGDSRRLLRQRHDGILLGRHPPELLDAKQ